MTPDNATPGLEDGACVGIVAGAGRLPVEIAEALVSSGRKVHIVAVDPAADEAISGFPHDRIALGQVGRLLSVLARNDCRDLFIGGAIRRPDLGSLRTDFGFYRHLPRILSLMRGGDDAVLRRVIRFFEDQGFRVRGLGELAPALLVGVGAMTSTRPAVAVETAAALGYAFIREIGGLDIGQAVIVRDGAIRAIEGAEGTDGMLRRVAEQQGGDGPPGGVLVKASKPQQDLRIDIPTIGPNTVQNCVAAKIGGIAVEADCSVIVDREVTLRLAEQMGIAILGMPQAVDDGAGGRALAPLAAPTVVRGRRKASRQRRKDAAVALHTLDRLGPHVVRASVVVRREYVSAVGVNEHPIDVARRARQVAARRRRRELGILGICKPDELGEKAIAEAARIGISGIAVQCARRSEDMDRLNSLAEAAGMFVATVAR